jgi:hypothetical protein
MTALACSFINSTLLIRVHSGRNLTTGYKEHIRNIHFNKDESAFAQHIPNKQHQYGPMTAIVEMVEYAKKGNLMNIKENFHIYHLNKTSKLIEGQKPNKESHIRTRYSTS